MINLHGLVRQAITALHPDETVTLRQSIGQRNERGRVTPVYGPVQVVQAQVQSLGQNDVGLREASRYTRIVR